MANQENGYLIADKRGDVLEFADTTKSVMSIGMHNNTPVTCLACQNSSPMGDSCKAGKDMDVVRHDEMLSPKADPETLLKDLCDGFNSNKKPIISL